MTLFCVPFSFISVLILKYWPFGAAMCKIVNFSQAVSVLISAYTLLAICIDRYLVVTRPLRPRLSKRVAKVIVSCVWIGAVVTAAPIFVVSELQKPSLWHEVCELDICAERWPTPQQAQRYSCLLLALQFALPLTVLVWTYARIARLVWGKRPPGEAETTRDNRIQYSKRKLVWTSHEEEWAVWAGAPYVWFACHWLAMSHSCYNPIIYCYMNSRYREGFKQVFIDLFRLKAHSASRNCHRSSFCEVLPLSEMVGVNTLYYGCGRHRNGNAGVGPILCRQKQK
ncbi:RYamide receptor-like [Aricia agestis]|uniref:RYamide receptor-like n=1 Tax=Aricia agestis TaxID=91739 RepID=UPI001C2040BD|nr:RYamide receptor-like [Aricia agestis]